MKSSIRRRWLVATALATATVAALPTPAALAKPDEPDVPSTIEPSADHKVYLVGHATGVQIYRCSATSTGFGWGFVAPRADLHSDSGQLIATHYGGPTWEARDGSAVVGARVDGVSVDPTAVPWLLLSATPAPGSKPGRIAHTTFIQRVATVGGLAPAAASCTADAVGDVVEVPYTADYYFWK
jgi:hypothetical protein